MNSPPVKPAKGNPKLSVDKLRWAVSEARHSDLPIRAVNPVIQRASTIVFDSVEDAFAMGPRTQAGQLHASSYGTVGTQTTFTLMDQVARLEGGGDGFRCALMPSGLSAITTVFLAMLKPGDHLLVSDSVYGPCRVFCETFLRDMQVEVTYVPANLGGNVVDFLRPTTRLLYLESPGSYTFELQDIPAVCAAIKASPYRDQVKVAIDNAWASPFYANPFDWGIDFSILPLTKHWGGHADVLMGAVVCSEALWPQFWPTVRQLGLCVSSDDAYLVLRGIRTAAVRMQQCSATAAEVVSWFEQQKLVKRVLWPALPSHPQHEIWKRDYQGAAALFSVELDPSFSSQQVNDLCNRLQCFAIGYSWGGFESLVMPAQISRSLEPWSGGPLVRFNIGLEPAATLIADLEQAFNYGTTS